METKKCTKCGEVKPVSEFGFNGEWRRNQCKSCRAIQQANRPLLEERIASEKQKLIAAMASHKAAKRRKKKDEKREVLRLTRLFDSAVLNDAGVKRCLGMPDAPPELIALKREQLQLFRLKQQLKQQLKGI